MRVTIHKDHGLTIVCPDETPVDIFMHNDGAVSINISPDEDDGDGDDDGEPDFDPCWSDTMLGRN